MRWKIMTVPTLLLALLAGCGTATPDSRRHPNPSPSVKPSPGPSALPPSVIVAKGHGWTSAGLDGPMPAPGTCHMRASASGEPLPDPKCTPGAVDSAVSQATIRTTICRPGGYTGSVRPPVSLTEPAKRKLLAAYGVPAGDIAKYELDHLIPLNSGGASDVRNLWPEPNVFHLYSAGPYAANDKDVLEDRGFTGLCTGKLTVIRVQAGMASDWTSLAGVAAVTPS